ncbi:hypothetical protein FisN_23Lh238 [Fistulifera solaris]|uniref:Uncharacterized protein n=1 Tax=Fistulifera solaris TaxID=1519565 RepID=A0A1Z5JRI1_FISSO|nr:hypothetical protein FisN_23Lh238 [Fistulifera solaris]|eukprot:GAX16633.1 hypothetical protein FisN_23Lh238 [Fistulifera solaris]
MILVSEDSPNIFTFPHEEILPCGQENMFIFPLLQGHEHGDSWKFQLGLSNCIWDIKMTSTLHMSEDIMRSSPFEVSADTASFEWSSRTKSGLSANIFMTEASITIDLVPIERILMSLWLESLDNYIIAAGSPSLDDNNTGPEDVSDEPSLLFMQEPSPVSFTTTESVKPTATKRTETCSYPKKSSLHPHFGEKQLQILQDMVQSELDEIDRLIFIVQVITGLLLAFLAWSLIENIFWPYRPSGSRASAGIPSSIVPINDEKNDDSFQLDATDSTPVLIHEGVQNRYALESHDNPDNYGGSNRFASEHGFKSSYLGEALRPSQGFASNAETNAMLSSTDDSFCDRRVPAKVTPERWTSMSNEAQAGSGLTCHQGHSVSEKRKRYIDVDCAPRSEEIGNRPDEMHKTEWRDSTSFIADYWE